MEGRSTWSGRERSSHSRFPPVPRVGLVTFIFSLLLPSCSNGFRKRFSVGSSRFFRVSVVRPPVVSLPVRRSRIPLFFSIGSLAIFNEATARIRTWSNRLCALSLLIQFPDDLSSSRTQMATEGFRFARRTGARGGRAHAPAGRRASAPRLSVHRNPRRRQDDALAHLRQGAQLRNRRDLDTVWCMPRVPGDRRGALCRLCGNGCGE
jgi:hypothetical protein